MSNNTILFVGFYSQIRLYTINPSNCYFAYGFSKKVPKHVTQIELLTQEFINNCDAIVIFDKHLISKIESVFPEEFNDLTFIFTKFNLTYPKNSCIIPDIRPKKIMDTLSNSVKLFTTNHINVQYNIRPKKIMDTLSNNSVKLFTTNQSNAQDDKKQYDDFFNNGCVNHKFSMMNLKKIEMCDNPNTLMDDNMCTIKHFFAPKPLNVDYMDTLQNIILVVDFPNIGGGTTTFINSIISFYKAFTVFLIVRNYGGNIKFTINDEYELNQTYNCKTASDLLLKYNNKIDKVFVNHTLGHSNNFMGSVYKLQKNISTVTHDFYHVFDVAQPYLHQIRTYPLTTRIMNINNFNFIITQNLNNLFFYHHFIKDKHKEIIVTSLPDYKTPLKKVYSRNKIIVVGIIGGISEQKGKFILNNIIDYYNKNVNVEVVVFGSVNIPSFKQQYIYHNVTELNELLVRFKPNILIELSIWPETYSYTLTLKMITDLPILYLKKTGNFTVEDRLSRYNKAYSFRDLSELNKLIYTHKQNYFYTIEPKTYFNSFWDQYFGYNTKKNVVLVTSKIVTSSNKLSYANNRSIYTTNERFNQTINTIESIKKYIPNPYIILFDNSTLCQEHKDKLINTTDNFINQTDDALVEYYTNICEYKAYGELSQLNVLVNELKHLNFEINNVFKLSGRYVLNNTFNYTLFNNEKNVFKMNETVQDREYYYTCFYKIKTKEEMIQVIESTYADIQTDTLYNGIDLEVFLPPKFYDKYLVDHLGVTEDISVWRQIKQI